MQKKNKNKKVDCHDKLNILSKVYSPMMIMMTTMYLVSKSKCFCFTFCFFIIILKNVSLILWWKISSFFFLLLLEKKVRITTCLFSILFYLVLFEIHFIHLQLQKKTTTNISVWFIYSFYKNVMLCNENFFSIAFFFVFQFSYNDKILVSWYWYFTIISVEIFKFQKKTWINLNWFCFPI